MSSAQGQELIGNVPIYSWSGEYVSEEAVPATTPRPSGPIHRILRVAATVVGAHSVGVLIAVVLDGHKLLLVQEGIRQRGRWGLPGGFLASHEQPQQAAARELLEETGLDLSFDHTHLVDVWRQPWARHIDVLFRVDVQNADLNRLAVRAREIRQAMWCELDELPTLTAEANYLLSANKLRLTHATGA